MNFKKFISGVSALTIAASAFAGMAVTANAATNVYTDAFTSGSASYTWSGNADKAVQADGASANGKGGYSYRIMGASNGRQRPAWTDVSSSALTGVIRVNLNLRMDSSYNNTSPTQTFKLLSETPTDGNNDTTGKSILEFASTTSDSGYNSSYTFNGTAISSLDQGSTYSNSARNSSGWLNLEILLNTNTKKFDVTIKRITNDKDNDTYTLGETVYSATNVDFMNDVSSFKSIYVFTARYPSYNGGQTWLDDISVEQLTAPAFTVESPVSVGVGDTAEVPVTVTAGTVSAAVASNDASVATGSYADGTLTVNGVAEGTTVLTLTATNDGLSTTQNVTVNVGAVQTANVITNYYLTGTTDAVPDKTTTTVAYIVGNKVDESTLDKTAIIKSDARYVYNSATINGSAASFPYTVPSTNDVIINVYFDAQAKANTLNVNYVNGSNDTIYTQTVALTDKYIGDNAEYYNRAYVDGTDGKLYKYNSLPATKNSTVGSNWSYQNTPITAVDNGIATVTLSYSEVANVAYALNESGTGSADQITSRVSGGNFLNSGSPYTNLLTAPSDGIYTITVATAWRSGWSSSGANGVVTVNNKNLGDVVTFTSTAPYVFVMENITLKAGDVIGYTTAQGRCGVDYALLIKTDEITAPSANLEAANWEVTDTATGYKANENVLTDAKGNSVYGYKATLEGNGIEYNTVKVYVKVADGEANNEKPYTDTKFGGSGYATFYVISDTALDTDASRVYCE